MTPRRGWLYCALALSVGALAYFVTGSPPEIERCERFTPVDQPLIAHAHAVPGYGLYTDCLIPAMAARA